MDVDIMELSKPNKVKEEEDDPDATECSSSFDDDSLSGRENHNNNGSACPSDSEVDSHFFDNDEFGFDGFRSLFPIRKRKLTAHWRNFIRPLMWRCKWAELKMKEIQSQALKYDRELAEFDQMKKMEQDQCGFLGSSSKSSVFTSRMGRRRRKIMKRRKRKRVESTLDIKSYISQHNLFSYNENKNTNSDGSIAVEEFCNPAYNDVNPDKLVDDGAESPEQFLRQITNIQSRVRALKSRLVSVISETQTSSVQSLNFSASMGGLYDMVDEDLVPNYCISIPDIIESTVGSSERIMDNTTIESILKNEQTEKEGGSGQDESSNDCKAKIGAKSSVKHEEEQLMGNMSGNVGIGPEICFPKVKRKRGDRKPGFRDGWNK